MGRLRRAERLRPRRRSAFPGRTGPLRPTGRRWPAESDWISSTSTKLQEGTADLPWLSKVAVRHNEIIAALARPAGRACPCDWASSSQSRSSLIAKLGALRGQRGRVPAPPRGPAGMGRETLRRFGRSGGEDRAGFRPGGAAGGGAEYLAAKAQRLQRRRQAEARARQSASTVEDRLKGIADSWHRLRPLPPCLHQPAENMVWNGAFLLPRSKIGPFHAACEQLRGELAPGGLLGRTHRTLASLPFLSFLRAPRRGRPHAPAIARHLPQRRGRKSRAWSFRRSIPSVHWVRQGFLTAATAAAAATATPSAQAANRGPLEHARLLTAIHRHIDILPARYGAVLPDEEAVRQFLHCHGEELAGELDRLRGTAEMGLRIDLPHGPLPVERSTVTASGGSSPSDAPRPPTWPPGGRDIAATTNGWPKPNGPRTLTYGS